jgi:NAD(P)-dependent dehydrogenase (short-subunit alcohol dehydrogenase family)
MMANDRRVALVTGTSSGIGAACVARLVACGWTVYAGVRRDEDGERLVASHGGDVHPVHIDVTEDASIEAAVGRIDQEIGRLDGVVNNAGVSVGGPFELLEASEWRAQFDVNVFGVIAVTKATFPLVEAAGGRFVHIGSIAGRIGSPGLAPYSASKHAVEGLNWALRAELARIGTMESSVVEPGEVKTDIWIKGRRQLRVADERLAESDMATRYEWLMDLFRGFLAEADARAIHADRVAEAVEHALTARRPKARYVVGTDAKVQAAIDRLPDRLRELLLSRAFDRYQRAGRSLRAGE